MANFDDLRLAVALRGGMPERGPRMGWPSAAAMLLSACCAVIGMPLAALADDPSTVAYTICEPTSPTTVAVSNYTSSSKSFSLTVMKDGLRTESFTGTLEANQETIIGPDSDEYTDGAASISIDGLVTQLNDLCGPGDTTSRPAQLPGEKRCVVPKVKNLKIKDAKSKVTAASCTVAGVVPPEKTAKKGQVKVADHLAVKLQKVVIINGKKVTRHTYETVRSGSVQPAGSRLYVLAKYVAARAVKAS